MPASTARCAARRTRAIMRPAWIVLRDAAARPRPKPVARTPRAGEGERNGSSADAPKGSAPAAAGHRRRFLRAPLLSRSCRRRSCGPTAGRRAPSSASPMFLLRLYRTEQPRAVLVAWDTLEVADLPAREISRPIRAGANSTTPCSSSFETLPEFVAACGFANAKAAGYEADDFLAAAAAAEEKRGGTVLSRAATATRSSLPRTAPPSSYPVRAARWRASARPRCARATASIRSRCRTSSRLRGDPSDKLPGAPGVGAAGAASLLQTIRHARSGARGRSVFRASRQAAALSLDRHHGPEGAAAEPPQPEADLEQGGRARASGASISWRSGLNRWPMRRKHEGVRPYPSRCSQPPRNGRAKFTASRRSVSPKPGRSLGVICPSTARRRLRRACRRPARSRRRRGSR